MNGIKGRSPAAELMDVDLAESFLYDEMHGICLGVARKVSASWLEKGERYSLTDEQVGAGFSHFHCTTLEICFQIATLNRRLLAFQPPKCFTRLPREFAPNLYKAHELRAFINHYSCFALNGVLKDCFLQHWRLLVLAYKTLSSESISPVELAIAGDNLREFVRLTPELYGKLVVLVPRSGRHSVMLQDNDRLVSTCTT